MKNASGNKIISKFPVLFLGLTIISCVPVSREMIGGIVGFRLIYYIIRFLPAAKGVAVLFALTVYCSLFVCHILMATKVSKNGLQPFLLLVLLDFVSCSTLSIYLLANSISFSVRRWIVGSLLELLTLLLLTLLHRSRRLKILFKTSNIKKHDNPHRVLNAVLVVLLIIFLSWSITLLHYETLTYRYGNQFSNVYKENPMIGEQAYWKVLSYSEDYARVYYVEKDCSFGNILSFKKVEDNWKYDSWESTVWSKTGSASGFIWPHIR